MDLYTTLADTLERHPEVEAVEEIPREDRRAILVAFRNESDTDLLVSIFHGKGFLADERENMLYEQFSAACWRALSGEAEDAAERERLINEWIWHTAAPHIDDALQDVRAEALA